MDRLAVGNRVLFIESLGLRRPTLQKKDILRIFRRVIKVFKGVRRIGENLFIYSPLVLPLHKYWIVRIFNAFCLRLQLNLIVKILRLKNPILWSYIPNAVEFLGKWNEKISVYHCVDELSANPLIPAVIREIEEEYLKRVNVVFASSQSLFQNKKKFNLNTFYMPNVADFDHFNSAISNETVLPGDLAEIPSPKIGFIGAISRYKLDLNLIGEISRNHPEWSIILIGAKGEGEKEAELGELENRKNIYLLGGRAYNSLPAYLKGFDVCLLPNLINEYTRNMFPMKFFEYLSAGKPVVSTRLEALLEFSQYCYISSSSVEFEENIIKALREDSQTLKDIRINLARQYTWEKRIAQMSEVIEARL